MYIIRGSEMGSDVFFLFLLCGFVRFLDFFLFILNLFSYYELPISRIFHLSISLYYIVC